MAWRVDCCVVFLMSRNGSASYASGYAGGVYVPDEAERDFAFADTVIATEDDLAPLSQPPPSMRPPASMRLGPPPSSPQPPSVPPGSVDPWAYHSHGSYPVPPSSTVRPIGHDPGLVTTVRGAFQRSTTEMKVLWSATEDASDPRLAPTEEDPFVRLAGHLSRMRTLWSFFEWDRADVMRAAWIGVAVFVIVATVGAFALQR